MCQGEAVARILGHMPRVIDLRVELLAVTPAVWRLLRVPATLSLADLHRAIQVVMEWDDYHLHVFEVADREYGPRPESADVDDDDESDGPDRAWAGEDTQITVADALAKGDGRIEYVYDFGDEWRLGIRRTAASETNAPPALACLDGQLAGPPEDSGGPLAYQRILDAWLTTGKRGLPQETREWLPQGFDPTRFHTAEANAALKEAFRPKASAEFPAGPGARPEDHLLADLTLLVLYLGSFQERNQPRRAWKNARFEILDALQEAGFIDSSPQRKSVLFTDDGERRAEALRQRVAPLLRRP
jgi:Plasmid pRiA4b ORF-3-like protein/Domain of unknown function (DUF6429)